MAEPILLTREGAVATFTLNRPELRNAICDSDTMQFDPGILVRIVDNVSGVTLSMAIIGPGIRSTVRATPAARSA